MKAFRCFYRKKDRGSQVDTQGMANAVETAQRIIPIFDDQDCTIVVQETRFRVHKRILMDASPVFCAMFNSMMVESTSNEIIVEDTLPTHFETMLRVLYGQPLPKEMLNKYGINLMFLANKYQDFITKACVEYGIANLTEKNAVKILNVADSLEYEELVSAVVDFIINNGSDIEGVESVVSSVSPKTAQLIISKFATLHKAARDAICEIRTNLPGACYNCNAMKTRMVAAIDKSGVKWQEKTHERK